MTEITKYNIAEGYNNWNEEGENYDDENFKDDASTLPMPNFTVEKEGFILGAVFPKSFGSNLGKVFKDRKIGRLNKIFISHSPNRYVFGIQASTSKGDNPLWGNKNGKKNVPLNTRNICITGVNIATFKDFVGGIQFIGKRINNNKPWKSRVYGNLSPRGRGKLFRNQTWNGCLQAFRGRSGKVLYKIGFIFKQSKENSEFVSES